MKLLLGLALLMVFQNFATAESPLAPGAKLEMLSDSFKFTEGPTSDADGNVYFTDQPNDRIHIWSVDGKLSTFMEPAGRSNGLSFDAAGKLWACADGKNELWKIDVATKKVDVVLKDFEGKLFNGPNDVWIRPAGGLYFTDPFFKRNYWTHRQGDQQLKNHLYFLSAEGKVSVADADIAKLNGLVGTPDGKTLYVTDPGAGKTYAYDIQTDGTLKNRRVFCKPTADGMTIDTEGNVYLTGRGVVIIDKDGKQIDKIDVPNTSTSNVCFGGRDHKTLFITATKYLYSYPMRVAGASPQ